GRRDSENVGAAGAEGVDLLLVDVEAGDRELLLAEQERQRQADVAESDNADVRLARLNLGNQRQRRNHRLFGLSGHRRVGNPAILASSCGAPVRLRPNRVTSVHAERSQLAKPQGFPQVVDYKQFTGKLARLVCGLAALPVFDCEVKLLAPTRKTDAEHL